MPKPIERKPGSSRDKIERETVLNDEHPEQIDRQRRPQHQDEPGQRIAEARPAALQP